LFILDLRKKEVIIHGSPREIEAKRNKKWQNVSHVIQERAKGTVLLWQA